MPLFRPLVAAPARLAAGFIYLSVALDMAGLGVSITVLPALVAHMAGGADAGWVNGVFVAAWAVAQFVCSPALGALSDRWGRRPLLLLSMAGLGLDYVVMALAPNLGWLMAGRLLSGATASSFSVCFAYVSDTTPEDRRAAAFGRLGAAAGLGFILGPAVGGMLGAVSLRAPFWAAAAFSLGNAALGLLVLRESLPLHRREPFRWRKANPLGAVALLRSHPELWGLSWTHLLSQFAGASIASVYVLYVGRRYGWSMRDVGLSLAFVGLAVAVVQGWGLARVTARLGERRTLLLGLAAGMVSLLAFALAPSGWGVAVGLCVFALWGLQGPATMALMSRRIGETEQGRLQGAVASLTSLADSVGPVAFGALYSATIGPRSPPAAAGGAFLAAAATLAFTLGLTARVLRGRGADAGASDACARAAAAADGQPPCGNP